MDKTSDTNQQPNTDASFWLGLTFDFPAYAGVPGVLPAHDAGRGLCVARHGGLLLRLADGSHVTVMDHDARHVAEIPRVEPGAPQYQSRVVFHQVVRDREYDAWPGWEITGVTSIEPSKVAITMRRRVS